MVPNLITFFHDNSTRTFVTSNNYNVFILDDTTEAIIDVVFCSINVVVKNISIATYKFVKSF